MRKGEVWFVDLPEGKGHEQKGERPAVVLCRANGLTTIIPLTGSTDKATFSFTLHIEPRPENGLSKDSIALVFQITAMDDSRFKSKIGTITKEQQDAIDKLILEMLKINPQQK
jgi:mRNA interferase MazF